MGAQTCAAYLAASTRRDATLRRRMRLATQMRLMPMTAGSGVVLQMDTMAHPRDCLPKDGGRGMGDGGHLVYLAHSEESAIGAMPGAGAGAGASSRALRWHGPPCAGPGASRRAKACLRGSATQHPATLASAMYRYTCGGRGSGSEALGGGVRAPSLA
jgi:hypothetical protein